MQQKVSQWPSLNIRVHPDVFAAIEQAADQRTVSLSVIVREALNAWVQQQAR
jgi:predicted HicB family RNase H-like nuclease